jgi:hypothetical protein
MTETPTMTNDLRAENNGLMVQINGLRFDAFGEERTRHVRISLDGSHMILTPREAEQYLADATACGDKSEYAVRDVWLSEREFECLPEFDGF